jgi:hypothetical protein
MNVKPFIEQRADPYILRRNGSYYFAASVPAFDRVILRKADTLEGLARAEEKTVWLTQEQIAQLYGKGRSTITEHISNIFKEGELEREKVCRKFRHTTQHGAVEGKTQSQEVTLYNLDVIISVGYRVKSIVGTR